MLPPKKKLEEKECKMWTKIYTDAAENVRLRGFLRLRSSSREKNVGGFVINENREGSLEDLKGGVVFLVGEANADDTSLEV
ncbi:hypothetical protein KY358_06145 [Candidatus Woesearchaeota archaeon]|nr:hypothetical protein [Candidatus Woesearchaeota archaeon]